MTLYYCICFQRSQSQICAEKKNEVNKQSLSVIGCNGKKVAKKWYLFFFFVSFWDCFSNCVVECVKGRYSKMNLGRVYPFGLRFNSSNADPMLAWSHGFQIAALNLQGRDRPVWLAKGFFQVNGHTGYVKKPDIFLPGFSLSHEDILNLPIKMILRVLF